LTTIARVALKQNGEASPASASEQYWEVLNSYRSELLRQARAILASDADAEDVVQETFCDALREPKKAG